MVFWLVFNVSIQLVLSARVIHILRYVYLFWGFFFIISVSLCFYLNEKHIYFGISILFHSNGDDILKSYQCFSLFYWNFWLFWPRDLFCLIVYSFGNFLSLVYVKSIVAWMWWQCCWTTFYGNQMVWMKFIQMIAFFLLLMKKTNRFVPAHCCFFFYSKKKENIFLPQHIFRDLFKMNKKNINICWNCYQIVCHEWSLKFESEWFVLSTIQMGRYYHFW